MIDGEKDEMRGETYLQERMGSVQGLRRGFAGGAGQVGGEALLTESRPQEKTKITGG